MVAAVRFKDATSCPFAVGEMYPSVQAIVQQDIYSSAHLASGGRQAPQSQRTLGPTQPLHAACAAAPQARPPMAAACMPAQSPCTRMHYFSTHSSRHVASCSSVQAVALAGVASTTVQSPVSAMQRGCSKIFNCCQAVKHEHTWSPAPRGAYRRPRNRPAPRPGTAASPPARPWPPPCSVKCKRPEQLAKFAFTRFLVTSSLQYNANIQNANKEKLLYQKEAAASAEDSSFTMAAMRLSREEKW